ncbi:hypothetical protein NX059_012008 [Plenodomus lindquistii]|nr:hypothetical protein NX059_012008 [Plenodomus lindquistii]
MTRTKVSVDFAFIQRYVDTFVLAAGVAPARAVGNIVIREGQCYHWRSSEMPNLIDLQLIIDLNKAAPNLSLDFHTALHGGFKSCLLDPLLHDKIPTQLHIFLDHAVSEIRVCAGPYVDVCVQFSIKNMHADRWMGTWTMAREWYDMRGRRRMEEWAEAVDLDDSLVLHYIRFKIDSPQLLRTCSSVFDGLLAQALLCLRCSVVRGRSNHLSYARKAYILHLHSQQIDVLARRPFITLRNFQSSLSHLNVTTLHRNQNHLNKNTSTPHTKPVLKVIMSANVNEARAGDFAGTKSFLLELPGELRNRIYDFAVEDDDEDTLIILRYCEQPSPRGRSQVHYSHGFMPPLFCKDCSKSTAWTDSPVRHYYGLTQVCRQIRTEYLPTYRARTRIAIPKCDVYQYIEMLTDLSGGKVENVIGNIVLFNKICRDPYGPGINLRPLMDIEKSAPRLKLSSALLDCVNESSPDPEVGNRLVDPLLNSARYPLLRRYVEENILNVTLEAHEGIHYLYLQLKDGLNPPSTEFHDDQTGTLYSKIQGWMVSVGLKPSQGWVFEYEFISQPRMSNGNDYWSYYKSLRPKR